LSHFTIEMHHAHRVPSFNEWIFLVNGPHASRSAGRITRRDFASTCAAMGAVFGVPASGIAAGLAPTSEVGHEAVSTHAPARIQSFRFENRRDLERAARTMRSQSPEAVLLDAIAAAHVPELIVISAHEGRRDELPPFVQPVYEVRRYSELLNGVNAFSDSRNAPLLHIPVEAGSVCVFGFASLAERAATWRSATERESGHALSEVGFYGLVTR
jgi:hypothetical protein